MKGCRKSAPPSSSTEFRALCAALIELTWMSHEASLECFPNATGDPFPKCCKAFFKIYKMQSGVQSVLWLWFFLIIQIRWYPWQDFLGHKEGSSSLKDSLGQSQALLKKPPPKPQSPQRRQGFLLPGHYITLTWKGWGMDDSDITAAYVDKGSLGEEKWERMDWERIFSRDDL